MQDPGGCVGAYDGIGGHPERYSDLVSATSSTASERHHTCNQDRADPAATAVE